MYPKINYHLNTAAIGQLHPKALATIHEMSARLSEEDFYTTAYPSLNKSLSFAKRSIAYLLGDLDVETIAFASSTSEAFSSIVNATQGNDGCILVAKSSFISTRALISSLKNNGHTIYEVGDYQGKVTSADVDRIKENKIRLVAIEWVNWLSGYRNDIQEIASYCRETNIPLLVDAVQGLGAVEVDFNLDAVGALVCGGHKWLRGPEGTGFTYVAPWLFKRLEAKTVGYRSILNPIDDISQAIKFKRDASVLEVGTLSTVGQVSLGSAVEELQTNAYALQAHYVREAISYFINKIKSIPNVLILTPVKSEHFAGILTFRLEDLTSEIVKDVFASHGLHCATRAGWVRLSAILEPLNDEFQRMFEAAIEKVKEIQND